MDRKRVIGIVDKKIHFHLYSIDNERFYVNCNNGYETASNQRIEIANVEFSLLYNDISNNQSNEPDCFE